MPVAPVPLPKLQFGKLMSAVPLYADLLPGTF